MQMPRGKPPVADVHTPEDLLVTAQALLADSDPQLRRAAVLEAITALESFVHRTVFGLLEETLDPLLVAWLDERTRMDFDARLGVLAPVATGRSVDKKSDLWANYKRAKAIRNQVTHSGRRVSEDEARFVVATVYEWLAFLGSTIELDLALLGLKRFVERRQVAVASGLDAARLVHDYFARTTAAAGSLEAPAAGGLRADVVLRYGQNSVVVETKVLRGGYDDVRHGERDMIEQVRRQLDSGEFARAALVLFAKGEVPEPFNGVRSHEGARISAVVIQIT